ncbi:hypothetical protein [Bradyrhizobium sp. ORS 285]|uniref:hypothetical protein n=1 Tax=Bradyrhizobium sp. ORS 285 TaxID=115808 RepID=UPI000240AC37|nr:hypothetical protein [Bradyrhizobium sp. ORS 285]CCD88807.1 membrane hypothetical protein [Bradyrhizobium sp. ORS 285]
MQRPENYTLFVELLFGGSMLMLAIAIICHLCTRRFLRSRHLALGVCALPLLTILMIVLSAVVVAVLPAFYSASYGYLPAPDEPIGLLGTTASQLGILLMLLAFLLVLAHLLSLAFLGLRVALFQTSPHELRW